MQLFFQISTCASQVLEKKEHGQAHGDDMGRLAPRKEAAGGYLKKTVQKQNPLILTAQQCCA